MSISAGRSLPKQHRLLIGSHAHPALSKGGAELAAWRQFESFRQLPEWRTWFIGCTTELNLGRLGSHITQPFSDDQFVYSVPAFDWFKFSNADPRYPRELEATLKATLPDILHFHHYANFGVETFLIAKRVLPDCKIVLTLHEFQAICNHYGQMVTKQDKHLCYASSPQDCHKCFPNIGRADFFLRRAYIQRFFELVDAFVSPSQFLAGRYVEWGLPAEKVTVIENIVGDRASENEEADRVDASVLRVGFFGQISFLKGIHVLLDAAKILENQHVDDIEFDIYGDERGQPVEFQEDFRTRLERAGRNVHFAGPYDNTRVDRLMQGVDLVLVPSIWWENSPIVIQECLRNRRPVVCSNIGGMAEKVRPGLDGFHFGAGNARDLATLLSGLARNRDRLAKIRATMQSPQQRDDVVDQHRSMYERLLQTDSHRSSRP